MTELAAIASPVTAPALVHILVEERERKSVGDSSGEEERLDTEVPKKEWLEFEETSLSKESDHGAEKERGACRVEKYMGILY